MEGDTLQVVNAVNSSGQNWDLYGQFAEDTRGLYIYIYD